MPFTSYGKKAVLDWMCGGAAASAPAGRFVEFVTGSPTEQSNFTGSAFTPRRTVTFAAANSPQGSATNVAAFTIICAQAAATVRGVNLWDASPGGGNRWLYEPIADIGCRASNTDQAAMSAGAFKIVID
jgi:hypothetical protein